MGDHSCRAAALPVRTPGLEAALSVVLSVPVRMDQLPSAPRKAAKAGGRQLPPAFNFAGGVDVEP